MAERLVKTLHPSSARKLVFVDVEASGLGSKSWPVEVGWAGVEGAPTSVLIKPHETWADEAWDPYAERLHGLDRERLAREGRSPREVCLMLNEAFEGGEVYSDAPDWDGFWLFRLYSAAGLRLSFSLLDYGRLVRPLIGVGDQALLVRAARLAPRRHRAADDARHLQVLYRLASENCAPRLTR